MESSAMLNTIESEKEAPTRIGGWLVLIGLGVIFAPLRILYILFATYPPIVTDGTWELLTTIGSESYSPIWGPLLIGEFLINLAVVTASFYMAFLFFTKNSKLPIWYASIALFSSIFIVVDAYIVTMVLPEIEMFDTDTIKELSRTLFALLIWTPYLLLSTRSRSTFTQ